MNKQQNKPCPGCGKPATPVAPLPQHHPNADVWHKACIMATTKHLREGK